MSKVNPIKRKIERILLLLNIEDKDTYDKVFNMVQSLVINRDLRIKHLEKRVKPFFQILTLKRISGALRCAIKDTGDITPANINTASKRIFGMLKQQIKVKGIPRWKLIVQYTVWLYTGKY